MLNFCSDFFPVGTAVFKKPVHPAVYASMTLALLSKYFIWKFWSKMHPTSNSPHSQHSRTIWHSWKRAVSPSVVTSSLWKTNLIAGYGFELWSFFSPSLPILDKSRVWPLPRVTPSNRTSKTDIARLQHASDHFSVQWLGGFFLTVLTRPHKISQYVGWHWMRQSSRYSPSLLLLSKLSLFCNGDMSLSLATAMNLIKLFITVIISGGVPQAKYKLLKYMLCNYTLC